MYMLTQCYALFRLKLIGGFSMKKLMLHATLITLTAASSGITAAASIFNVNAVGNTLNITTNIPNHDYPLAGIKVNTNGFRVAHADFLTVPATDCTMLSNGFCQFTANSTQPATIVITSNSVNQTANLARHNIGNPVLTNVNVSICLNATAPLSCQSYTLRYTNTG